MKKGTDFTHFGSIPFIRQTYRQQFVKLQNKVTSIFKQKSIQKTLKPSNPNLFHLTLTMLNLPHQSTRIKVQQMMKVHHQQLRLIMKNVKFLTDKIGYFTFKNKYGTKKNVVKNVSVIYLDVVKDKQYQKVIKLTDLVIRMMLKQQIIVEQDFKDMHIQYNRDRSMYMNSPHITLFRCENLLEDNSFIECFNNIQKLFSGVELQCDYIDISTRWSYDETKFYAPFYRIDLNEMIEEKKEIGSQQINKKQDSKINKIDVENEKNIVK